MGTVLACRCAMLWSFAHWGAHGCACGCNKGSWNLADVTTQQSLTGFISNQIHWNHLGVICPSGPHGHAHGHNKVSWNLTSQMPELRNQWADSLPNKFIGTFFACRCAMSFAHCILISMAMGAIRAPGVPVSWDRWPGTQSVYPSSACRSCVWYQDTAWTNANLSWVQMPEDAIHWVMLLHTIFYPSALWTGGVLSSRSGRVGGRAGGCQICGTHISVTAWRIFSIRSSVELSRPLVVHCHGHLPICPIWACPWAKNSNFPQIGSRLCGSHISETAGWMYPI